MLKWVLGAGAAYVVLVILEQRAYSQAAASCNAQCPIASTYWIPGDAPVVAAGNPAGLKIPTFCNCTAYNQFQQQWGWFAPFVPSIEI